MNRAPILSKHGLQPLVTGTAELGRVVLVHELNILPPPLKFPPHGFYGSWERASRGESGIPVGDCDVALVPLESSTPKHSLADVVHDLLLLPVLREAKFPDAPLEVQGQDSIENAKKLREVKCERLEFSSLGRGEKEDVLLESGLAPPNLALLLGLPNPDLCPVLLLEVPPRSLLATSVKTQASNNVATPGVHGNDAMVGGCGHQAPVPVNLGLDCIHRVLLLLFLPPRDDAGPADRDGSSVRIRDKVPLEHPLLLLPLDLFQPEEPLPPRP